MPRKRIFVDTSPKKLSAIQIAKQNKSDIRKIKQGTEVNEYYTSRDLEGIEYNGELFVLNDPEQGIGDRQRIGDKMRCIRIEIKGIVYLGDNVNTGLNSIRILLMRDKQVNVANWGDVVNSVGNINAPFSPFRKDTRKRWVHLGERNFSLTGRSRNIQRFSFNKKLNFDTVFSNGTTTILTNCLALGIITDEPTATVVADRPLLTYSAVLKYVDA